MPRRSLPTCSTWEPAASSRMRWKFSWPASFSAIHSLANSPDWMSARIFLIAARVSSVITFGPRVMSPYSAVFEIEWRMPWMPCSYIRSTISLSSCRHSK